jgi:soluble lytic murein transglycosylase
MRPTRRGQERCHTRLALATSVAALLACQLPTLPVVGPPPTTTPAPTPLPTPTSIPTATPTPTPLPADLIEVGQQALFIGDSEGAILAFQAALDAAPEADTAADALFGLGRALLQDGAYLSAVETFDRLVARFPTSALVHPAHFLLAEALSGSGEPLEAAAHYSTYLEGGTDIAAYVSAWIGDARYAAGDTEGAVAAYQAALAEPPDLSFEVSVRELLALAHVALLEYDQALAQYEAILAQAEIPAYRALIAHQAAQTLLLAGRTEEGHQRHLEVVNSYSTSPWAYQSLIVLVEAGVPVDDLTRGIVDYFGGAYDPAVAALYRYVEASPDHSGDAHYYAGLAHLAAGSPTLAEAQFRTLVETHRDSARWGDGWMGWAQALVAMDELEAALEVYRDFARYAPDHPRAAEALWAAAQILEGSGELAEAARAYEDCQTAYPAAQTASAALLRAGLQHYQLGALDEAVADWQLLAEDYPTSEYQAAGLLWLGRAHLTAGQPISATAAFDAAAQADPGSYYGLRASDLAADPLAPIYPPSDYTPLPDPAAGQREAEAWLADWLGLPSTDDLGELDPALASDLRLRRGLELWQLGRYEEAKTELEALRAATDDDPLAQYRLALLFRDIGLYRSSILAASTLIRLSPAATPLEAPPFLARLVYPTYYHDLVLSNAMAQDLPPPLLFSLIRQESLFEGFATSTAYAHGLMQVIPSTGASIASQLDWPPDYETTDLYRPMVSVRFGSYYLAQQRDYFEGRIDIALAAYNGGPGNAARWVEVAGDDPDLFLELITLGETRLYLELIREHYAAYTALY